MVLKEKMVSEVASVIEETSNFVTNRLVMESLLKNGKVTLEEATFFNELAKEVITEAAEDFIPETISFEEAEFQVDEEAKALEEAKAAEDAKALEEAKAAEDAKALEESTKAAEDAKALEEAKAAEDAKALEESTKAAEEAKVAEDAKALEESTQAAESAPVELTESELIVNRLIAKMV